MMKNRRWVATLTVALVIFGGAAIARAQIDLSGSFNLGFTSLPEFCNATVVQNGSSIDLTLQCLFTQAGATGTIDATTGIFSASGGCMVGPGNFGTLQMDGTATADSASFSGQLSCPPAIPGGPYAYLAKRKCPPSPFSGCRAAGKSFLTVQNDADNANDKLLWKFLKGGATMPAEFGSPTETTGYTLCVYAGSAAARAIVPPSATNWKPLGTAGWKYKDALASAYGVTKLALKGGAGGRTKVQVKGRGTALPDFDAMLPVDDAEFPVTVQLIRNTTNLCWESRFDAADANQNAGSSFKATSAAP
jgi:hypothetical protein